MLLDDTVPSLNYIRRLIVTDEYDCLDRNQLIILYNAVSTATDDFCCMSAATIVTFIYVPIFFELARSSKFT